LISQAVTNNRFVFFSQLLAISIHKGASIPPYLSMAQLSHDQFLGKYFLKMAI